MRGKPFWMLRQKRTTGITPAHAGKTKGFPCLRKSQRDHPRACGENRASLLFVPISQGSPPRMRGKRVKGKDLPEQDGITPAHAGKTRGSGCWCDDIRDHPRACGENRQGNKALPCRAGSPPRMRGKRVCAGIRCWASGITPAHAGKTSHTPSDQPECRDHPRACGENPPSCSATIVTSGSPPRMRGKPRCHK